MKQINLALIALFSTVLSVDVSGQDSNNPWAITSGVNVIDIRSSDEFSQALNDHFGTGDWNVLPSISKITAERYLNNNFAVQLAASLNRITHVSEKNDADLAYYSIDANLKYDLDGLVSKVFGGNTQYFNPFVYLGTGYTSLAGEGELMLNVGFGLNVWLTETVGLVYQTGTKQDFSNVVPSHYQHSLGIAIKFGGVDTDGDGVYDKYDACPEVPGLEEFQGCPETDGDGIIDKEDACPDVSGLATLNGCPDADADGIADKDDLCPNDKGTKANGGCPDSDGDGIVDKDDTCPTKEGPKANGGCPWPDTDGDGVLDKDDGCVDEVGPASNKGCPEPIITKAAESEMMELAKSILFDTGMATFKKDGSEKLDGIIKIMKMFMKATFVIEGHADSTGNKVLNDKLSVKRALGVQGYLIKGGVEPTRLETKGYGQTKPIDSNSTVEGRAKNRRVEIRVSNKQ